MKSAPASGFWKTLKKPPWRTMILLGAVLIVIALAYLLWSPGADIRDGRHDLGANAIWLSHGWLGGDEWFERHGKEAEKPRYRSPERIRELASLLEDHGITDAYPHLCPAEADGSLPPVDREQVKRFLESCPELRVLPWIGGARDDSAFPDDPAWRAGFAASAGQLLAAHPELAGVHVNIEPCPSGSQDFLKLLDELRAVLPRGKILSVAAYPPPTRLHPHVEVHWDEAYYREVARRCDQMAVMMYDTALSSGKLYQSLMADWTREVLQWSGDTKVLLGLPAYDDAGVGYHDPRVENLRNAFRGIHAGLSTFGQAPANYQGVALYSGWEMDASEWRLYRERFRRTAP